MNIKAGQVWRYRQERTSDDGEKYIDDKYLFLVKMIDYNDIDEQFWEVKELGKYGGQNHYWFSLEDKALTLMAPSSSG